jgi:diadenylate cyclase
MLNLLITGFIHIRLVDVIDILLVAFLLYEVYYLLKGTVAINIFFGIVAIFFIWQLTAVLQMQLLREILGAFFSVGFIALFIIFQPEIRQFLFNLGKPNFIQGKKRRFLFWKYSEVNIFSLDIDKVVHACQRMSNIRQGALIVLTRENELFAIRETGQAIHADISIDLLENLFFPNSPLHDGAVIISRNKIQAARCILPVSKSHYLPSNLGLRHRAAVGITEISDAIAVVVSEQTGRISYSWEGQLTKNVKPNELQDFLQMEFGNGTEPVRNVPPQMPASRKSV